jgi:hypothetical protein
MRVVLFVARRKFFTEIVTCRIAESLDLKWLEDITNRPNETTGRNAFYFRRGQ